MNLLAWCVKFSKMINHTHTIINYLRLKQPLMCRTAHNELIALHNGDSVDRDRHDRRHSQ